MNLTRLRRLLIGTWSWKRPFYSLGSIYLLLLLLILFAGNRLIFRPPAPKPDQPFTLIEGPRDQKISLSYHAPETSYPVLLWSHGNAEDLSTVSHLMPYFQDLGFGTLAYDYPGYGHSEGSPNEDSCLETAEAVYQHLTENLNHSPKEIVLCGQSVGSGPTTWLASQKEHHALVLIAPFLSTFRSVTRIPIFPKDRFLNLKLIPEIHTPLLIIHGQDDGIIPHSQGQKLFDLSPSQQKTFLSLPEAGHNDLYALYLDEITQQIAEIFRSEKVNARFKVAAYRNATSAYQMLLSVPIDPPKDRRLPAPNNFQA